MLLKEGFNLISRINQSNMLRTLSNRNFSYFWSSQTISTLGSFAYATAIPIIILQMGGGAKEISLAESLMMAPQVVFMLFGGVATDRWPRKMLLLICDIVRGIATAWFFFLMLFGSDQFWYIYVVAFIMGLTKAFTLPGIRGFVPEIVKKKDLLSANSLRSLSSQISRTIGPLIVTVLISTIGVFWAIGFNAISFFISAILLFFITGASRLKKQGIGAKEFWGDLREGFGVIKQYKWLLIFTIIEPLGNLSIAGFDVVALPVFANDELGGATHFTYLRSSLALGAVFAALVLSRTKKVGHQGILYFAIFGMTGIAILFLSLVPYFIPALLFTFFIGIGTTTFVVVWESTMQNLIPSHIIGRVASVEMFASGVSLPLGYQLIGWLIIATNVQLTVLLCGFSMIVLSCLALSFKSIRALTVDNE
jgi:MFS family permease